MEQGAILERVAEYRTELTAAKQLLYLAAAVADDKGWAAAKVYVSMIKVAAPRVALKILDEAIQVHGAHGLSQDSRLTDEYIDVRHVRFADGPDAVHLREVSKAELKKTVTPLSIQVSGTNPNIAKYGKFPPMPKL